MESKKFLVSIVSLITLVNGHSWLECTKYDLDKEINDNTFDSDSCGGWMREWKSYGPDDFGEDHGADFEVTYTDYMCEKSIGNPNNGYSDTYATEFPLATYTVGETVRLLWPAKNHANYECQSWQLDHGMRLYVNTNANPTEDLGRSTDEWTLVIDWHEGYTFETSCTDYDCSVISYLGIDGVPYQNCPHFCDNTDLAICYGDFVVPDIFPEDGYYTFVWYWEMKKIEIYTSCFEVYVEGTDGASTQTSSPTNKPTDRPTTMPTDNPTDKPTDRPTDASDNTDDTDTDTDFEMYINAGYGSSSIYTDSNNIQWYSDNTYINNGYTFSTSNSISNLPNNIDEKIFQSERWLNGNTDLIYTINGLTSGTYNVYLYFAEIYFTASNKRIFDIKIQGSTVETSLDIYSKVGKDTALTLDYSATVSSNGQLIITLARKTENPKISGIKIVAVDLNSYDIGSGQVGSDDTSGNSGESYTNNNDNNNDGDSNNEILIWIVAILGFIIVLLTVVFSIYCFLCKNKNKSVYNTNDNSNESVNNIENDKKMAEFIVNTSNEPKDGAINTGAMSTAGNVQAITVMADDDDEV